jgi:hypothetical protein
MAPTPGEVITVAIADVPPDAELLLPHEAARMLRLDAKTLSRWHKAGYLAAVVLPTGHRRFWRSDIEAILRGAYRTPRPVPATRVEGQLELPLGEP